MRSERETKGADCRGPGAYEGSALTLSDRSLGDFAPRNDMIWHIFEWSFWLQLQDRGVCVCVCVLYVLGARNLCNLYSSHFGSLPQDSDGRHLLSTYRCLIYISPPLRQAGTKSPCFTDEEANSEKLSSLIKVTQLVRGKVRIQTESVLLPGLGFSCCVSLPLSAAGN